jgi:anti-sigma factor RsiW
MSAAPRTAAPPTDEELMLFVDGELEATRDAEVAVHVASDPTSRRKVLALRLVGDVLRETSSESSMPVGIVDTVMGKIDALDRPASRVVSLDAARTKAAARRIYSMAAVAVAAAAAIAVWARAGTEPGASPSAVAVMAPSPSLDVSAPPPERPIEVQAVEEHGAEVAAVDFGTRTGSIFYVPTEAAEPSVLAVVWISDSEVARP